MKSKTTVALRVRAWIEIMNEIDGGEENGGRSPCESVDWNIFAWLLRVRLSKSLSVWERGLKFVVQN